MINKNFWPNLITILNLLSGAVGISFVIEGNLIFASIMIFCGTIFDFFDGFVARLLKVDNPIGKELDSLADLITFGLLPSFLLYSLLTGWLKYLPFLLVVAAALRLAKFNNDETQKYVFKGLPTPAAAIFVSSWVLMLKIQGIQWASSQLLLVVIIFLLSYLMVSRITMFSLKVKNFWLDKENKFKFAFLIFSLILVIALKFIGLELSILFYIFLSLFNKKLG